ncbi:MAG: DUF3021 domain-containing protein [Clostridia bacterium]|nr:DUF3021 domain-containing protein [Clostridia bacterium]
MERFIPEFLRRGMIAAGIGPIVLAVIYLILRNAADLQTLTVSQVCIGIFSLTALSFVAGGMNALYQLERLPLMVAILIHGCVLYVSYLATYLLNDWLDMGVIPIVVFSAIFVVGYAVIWAIVYSIIKKSTSKLNERLRKKQHSAE